MAKSRSKAGWDLRSNMKATPGSQGTLFQGGQKTGNKWARGYNPERLAEVRAALSSTPINGPGSRPVGKNEAGEPRYDSPQLRSFIVGELARSTAPAADFRGLSRIGTSPGEGRSGAYWPKHKAMDVRVDQSAGAEKFGATLMHEMGHHADLTQGRTAATLDPLLAKDRATYAPQAHGRAEAFADNYMEQHFVPHRRSGVKSAAQIPGATYDQRFSPEHLAQNYPGYREVRQPSKNLGPQFHQPGLF